MKPGKGKIVRIEMLNIMKSKTKPLLLQIYVSSTFRSCVKSSKVLLKVGDDMRQDANAMKMFRMMNYLWANASNVYKKRNPIVALTYHVVPIDNDKGMVEFIEPVKTLQKVLDYQKKFGFQELNRLIATASGSYIASYVLGVRDRHWDNVLIKDDDTLFHIDFGFCLGSKAAMDASKT
eukprot:UN00507